MAAQGARVLGLDKLKRKFHDLPPELQLAIRKASEDGAGEMVGMAKRLVPQDSGDLRDSIDWSYGGAPKGSIGAVGSRKGGTDVISVHAGDKKAFYARWVEFGTVKMPARPYFFPAFRALKKRMISRNKRAMNKVAKKVAAGGN
jgi:HK97 gp10 family phage protein